MRKKLFRFHILLFTFISLWSQAQVIRVAPTPSGSGNGSSWANASSLQNAIANANANNQIWVKRGTYLISGTLNPDQYNLHIYGGFAGNENALNQRDWENNITIFNGQNTVKIMRFESNNGVIDGIQFRNGFVTGTVNTTNDGGGALRLTGVDQIIRNCTFLNNRSTSERGGGAIFIWHGGGQLIENCFFQNNTQTIPNSNGGGAIHNWDENVIIRNCRFVSNNSSSPGGAVYSWGQNFRLEGSTFENNHSDAGGGAVSARYFSNTIINCNFIGNTANGDGGALINSDVTKVINCLFNNNEATGFGGAIYNNQELEVTNSTFVNNNNTAVGHSRFATNEFSTYLTSIYNSIFYGNTAKNTLTYPDISCEFGNANDDSDKDIRRNIVQEYDIGANNLIGIDPLFVNNTNNFTLQISSPAINAGNNTLYNQVSPTNATASTDLNGNPRLFGIAVDYGAYELQQPITVPACTSATIPANGATNIDIATNFSWTAVTGATSYTLQIGTVSGTWNILNQNVGNVTTFNLPNDLNYSTQYFVRIIPSNSAGSASGCSVTNFITEAQPITVPACTSAIIPANGATNIDIATNFSWTAVTGATSYTLQIGTVSGTWDILNQNVGNVTTFDLPNDLNYSTQYFVRIIPSNSAGSASGCSVTNFTTEAQPITVPACTSATIPANGATNIGIATNFSWTTVTGATSYTLQIGTVSGTWNILNQNVGNVTAFDLPNDLNYSTQYFVRIIPSNSAGSASGCSVTNFTTEAQPITVPACTAATIPANGATNIGIATNFSWTTVTGATSYTLQIGTVSGTWNILNQNVGNITTFDLPNDLNYSTQYFVRIIPSNSAGSASGCSVTNFTTEAQPITVPACTSATIPANGATNIGIATNFSWTAVTGATSYTLQIGTVSGTWDILNQNVGNVTTFDLPNDLNYSTQYFVRIIPSNSAGSASGCSVTNFITVYGDEDGDGVTDDKDQCPNTPLGIPVDSNGCPVCSEPLMTTINIQENDAEISFSGGIGPFNYRVDNGLWQSTSSNSIVLNDLEGGLHTIEINSADTCETILEFSIIEIHNVITPNGDGINDVLDLSTLLLKEEPKLIIVDRYSNKIFEGNANNQFIWDGKLNGRPIKTDSYWFYMQWKEPNSQTPSKKQGWILVKNR